MERPEQTLDNNRKNRCTSIPETVKRTNFLFLKINRYDISILKVPQCAKHSSNMLAVIAVNVMLLL